MSVSIYYNLFQYRSGQNTLGHSGCNKKWRKLLIFRKYIGQEDMTSGGGLCFIGVDDKDTEDVAKDC